MEATSTRAQMSLVGLELARACGRYADDKQAEGIIILDLRGISQLTDFFVICTGNSLPHLKAVRGEIADKLVEDHGVRPNHKDGIAESQWMILDYIDVVVHIFHHEKRSIYSLEDLWGDAPRLDWKTGEALVEEEVEVAEEV